MADPSPQQDEVVAKRDPRLDEWPEDKPRHQGAFTNILRPFQFVSAKWHVWSYAYMNVVLARGASQNKEGNSHMSTDDLYVVPKTMHSQALVERFHKQYVQASTETSPSSSDKSDNASKGSDVREPTTVPQLLAVLWPIAKATFVPAGFCELLVVLCGTSIPLLVMQLLKVLEDHPNQAVAKQGLPIAFAIVCVSILNGFVNNRHRHLAMKTGVALRASVVNILYERILELSPAGKNNLTSGEVANLVAVDTQKLFEVSQDAHLIWALPLNVALVSTFLYRAMGVATIVGIVVLMGFGPAVHQVTIRMLAIRQKRIKYTDERVEVVSNLLQGIKIAKLNNYEANYHSRLSTLRNLELSHLGAEIYVWALTLVMVVTSPVVATGVTFATYVVLDEDNILTASDTFGVLLLMTALRYPISFAGRLVGKAGEAYSALKRIAAFLDRPVRTKNDFADDDSLPDDLLKPRPSNDAPLCLSDASFRIGDGGNGDAKTLEESSFTVSSFNFAIEKGQILVVCGPVGSGKSTLINGILGEAHAVGNTKVSIQGKVSYVPQTPFILNQTVRDNILFGLPFDEDRYERILDACCLRADLKQLGESGDLTEIGERGVTMSGGQKQRVSLARAVYAKSLLYIFDDPFSALDSGTGRQVFENLLSSPNALLKDTAVMLVTHASHFISNRAVDKILVLVDGTNRFLGTWDELARFSPSDESTLRAVNHIKASAREDSTDGDEDDEQSEDKEQEKTTLNKKRNRLVRAEQREHGESSLRTWLLWFQRAGGLPFFGLQLSFMAIDRCMHILTEVFLAKWTGAVDTPTTIIGFDFPPQIEGRSAQAQYLKVYITLVIVSCVATLIRSEWAVSGGVRATKTVFENMLSSVLKAPLSYFETVPLGRILNRFTYDTDINDVLLTQSMSRCMIATSWIVASIFVQIVVLPWTSFSIFPVLGLYWMLMIRYRKSGPDLQRIDALTRSPVQSMVNECLEGSTSIRVFHQDSHFVHQFREVADTNSAALLNFVTAQRWLGVRMELLGSAVVLVATVLVTTLNDSLGLEAGVVGLLITWASNFTFMLNYMIDIFSETEAAVTAIERVDAMAVLPTEKSMKTNEDRQPPAEWPTEGSLTFDSVAMRYREGMPLALNGLSFHIPPGKSCGVVGRTGAGKSSITVSLFRLVEIESGHITLDGVDLGTLGLEDVRGKGMSIIPQDPFLAGATLRECLDPFNKHTDSAIAEALTAVRMGSSNSDDTSALLSTRLEEGGSNFSVGERQLINLARAFLTQPKVLVLDEATASIDGETDAFIQKMLRTRFPGTTLMTIAHRLETIMDYDFVLVMDFGKAAEFGHPADLLENESGIFSSLVEATGVDSSNALRELAREAKMNKVQNK
eukprot:Nitzschia sp. Nitz4//scaffold84_size84139//32260//36378//NITZ4_005195-RA/size84139-processed-gene-0.16-mRNA-1//-1//CDS//3329559024//8911//frame0